MKLKSLCRLARHDLLALFQFWRTDGCRSLMVPVATEIKSGTLMPHHDGVILTELAVRMRIKTVLGPLPKRSHMLHEPDWLKILKLLAKLGYVTLKCRLLRLKGLYLRRRLRQANRKIGVLLDDNRALIILQRETLLKNDGGTMLVDELLQCGEGIQCHDLNSSANVKEHATPLAGASVETGVEDCSAPLEVGQPFVLIRLLGCIVVGGIGWGRGI